MNVHVTFQVRQRFGPEKKNNLRLITGLFQEMDYSMLKGDNESETSFNISTN